MSRQFYLDLASHHIAMPIGADLVLREKHDADDILLNGDRLGQVVAEAAERYHTPLAFSLMDLTLEKAVILETLGVPADQIPQYHFSSCPDQSAFDAAELAALHPSNPRVLAQLGALKWVSERTELIPIGMSIGPFSLMTKLLADPITPVYLSGMGIGRAEDDSVKLMETVLDLVERYILASLETQIKAGARAVFIAEPAANKVYISPKQLAEGSDVFDRLVLRSNGRIRDLLAAHGVDLIFHCCGELVDSMVSGFGTLRPVILSLGSSRKLWEDAALVPRDVVLFGNLPSKRFYSDDEITSDQVEEMALELTAKMRAANHPFILGTECDVLSVPGCEDTIMRKVHAIVGCCCGAVEHAAAG